MCVSDHGIKGNFTEDSLHAKYFTEYNSAHYSYKLPDEIDWRTSGAVTFAKDQLRCSSSYAFAAIGALEGATALSGDGLVALSAQNIVDCSGQWLRHTADHRVQSIEPLQH